MACLREGGEGQVIVATRRELIGLALASALAFVAGFVSVGAWLIRPSTAPTRGITVTTD